LPLRGLDGRARLQGAEHGDRAQSGSREFRRDVGGDPGEAEDAKVKHLPAGSNALELGRGKVAQADLERVPLDRACQLGCMRRELVADRGPDEIAAIRVEALLHHQVDAAEVDVAEVDGDLLRLDGSLPEGPHVVLQLIHLAICQDGIWMAYGWTQGAYGESCVSRWTGPRGVLGEG
jgi:hypothetical protein